MGSTCVRSIVPSKAAKRAGVTPAAWRGGRGCTAMRCVAVALFAFVVALAAANTAHVKVSWLFGNSHVSLVWLVLAAAVLGWLLGLVTNAALHRRTRAPRAAPRPRTDPTRTPARPARHTASPLT